MRSLKNLNREDAEKNGWEILKPLANCEILGKSVYNKGRDKIMKVTKRIKVEGGFLYNTSTEYHKGDGISIAEALVFVAGGN